ncbi:Mucin [Madurella fahalii]|uniref:Mucin n=1 Tax=Madurella fahalii TaxID=1157608 RepID=A0ABQ0GDU5_9PEZI
MPPYNTRHKTVSLQTLGIRVPGTQSARAPANRASPTSASPISMASPAPLSKDDQPPAKKLKRAFSEDADDALASERLPKKRDYAIKPENTPPPSPPAKRPSIEMGDNEVAVPKVIDMEGINDEIVEAVIIQLQNTRNRPHLVKELTAVLMEQLKIVQQSANPCAIVSSRLATYLKRPGWSALAPCPLAKELESVHPRRTYFYLTTCPHQPLPDPAQTASLSHPAHGRAIISPSPSSAASNSADESDLERRRELSPSPEVDLSSPEFDDMDDDFGMPSTPIGSFSLRSGFYMPPSRLTHGESGRNNRAASPPLEKDEKEFTQTADGLQKRLQKRKLGTDLSVDQTTVSMDLERDDSSLFGVMSAGGLNSISFVSSPAIRPSTVSLNFGRKDGEMDSWVKLEGMLEWDRSPENIELDELDGLLDDY